MKFNRSLPIVAIKRFCGESVVKFYEENEVNSFSCAECVPRICVGVREEEGERDVSVDETTICLIANRLKITGMIL